MHRNRKHAFKRTYIHRSGLKGDEDLLQYEAHQSLLFASVPLLQSSLCIIDQQGRGDGVHLLCWHRLEHAVMIQQLLHTFI